MLCCATVDVHSENCQARVCLTAGALRHPNLVFTSCCDVSYPRQRLVAALFDDLQVAHLQQAVSLGANNNTDAQQRCLVV